jgi:hypothetical protein
MKQYQDPKLNPIQIRQYTICFRELGNHQVRSNWEEGNCFAFRATVIGVFIFTVFPSDVNALLFL